MQQVKTIPQMGIIYELYIPNYSRSVLFKPLAGLPAEELTMCQAGDCRWQY